MAEYIERQTVVDMLQNLSYDDWNQGASTTWANAFSECAEMIRDIPTADVRPVRRGRWEEVEVTWLADVEDQPDAIASMFCPVCKRSANHVYHYGDARYGMNFCPWCGARMGGDAK